MNNFEDDEFTEKDSNPDLDLNTDPGLKDAEADSGEEEEKEGFFTHPWVRIPWRVGAGLFLVGWALAIYWSRMPKPFQVEKTTNAMAVSYGHREETEPLPVGYRTVATTLRLAEILLEKPGGFMHNDWVPMSRWTDNMRNWERGAIQQLRIMTLGLYQEISRQGPQAPVHEDLEKAFAMFSVSERQWFPRSSESQYRKGIAHLENYLQLMADSESEGRYFATRQDRLINWLTLQQNQLGTYSTKMQMNVGAQTYDTTVLSSEAGEVEELAPGETVVANAGDVTPFFKRDNVFYEVRGGVYVMYHCMLAIRKDFEDLINQQGGMGPMNRIINELEAANKPISSPMVLNGREFGVLQNHSLVMASHLAKAHLAMTELQQQLRGGGNL
jgi:hypothetical protein